MDGDAIKTASRQDAENIQHSHMFAPTITQMAFLKVHPGLGICCCVNATAFRMKKKKAPADKSDGALIGHRTSSETERLCNTASSEAFDAGFLANLKTNTVKSAAKPASKREEVGRRYTKTRRCQSSEKLFHLAKYRVSHGKQLVVIAT